MLYVFEIAEGDAKISGAAVAKFETENEAVASFHSRLSTAMKSELYTGDMCMVITEEGAVLRREKFTRA
jgi:hypothetical protein